MEFGILGETRVVDDGAEIPLGGAQRRALLAALLVDAGHVVAVDRLVRVLWGETPPMSAAQTVQSHISRLRKLLGAERIHTLADGYRLQVAPGEVDAGRFEDDLEAGKAALHAGDGVGAVTTLERALRRWRGPALDGAGGGERTMAEAARLDELRASAVESLLEARLTVGEHGRVVADARAAVAEWPWRERLWGSLMLALYRGGRQADALAAYQEVRGVLADELGLEPSPELADLELRILRHDPSLATEARPGPASTEPAPQVAPLGGLPTGTITFLFTDIEGSTALWEAGPEPMRTALQRHDSLLRQAIEQHRGYVFAGGGDGLGAAFGRAADAVAAALDAQQSLIAEVWPSQAVVRVRMGLHSGEATERGGDYYGSTVNRAARLMSAGHGGQVLVSAVTEGLVREAVPKGVELVDLGEHRLRDLAQPMRVFQAVMPDLPRTFPSLRTLESYPGNLPLTTTRFVGREAVVSDVAQALEESRIVTVTGVGGVGKTRLALQVAAEVLPGFPDGAWLVELGAVGDPDSVEEAVASALGLQARPRQTLRTTLLSYLHDRRLLLTVDNCEHVVTAVAELVERVTAACSGVRVLATSREGLAVAGERVIPLAPMELPAEDTPDGAARCEAVQLLVDRVEDVRPGFVLTSENAAVVSRLCRRLDGIPLALELAAARLRSMSPADVLGHLDQRFRFLTGGRRTALNRQHTLRGAIDWSYDLLDDRERSVLRRLCVFAGGFELAAAEEVASGNGVDAYDVADVVDRLVDKSLVVADVARREPRYRLLDTIRDYAWERLVEAGEADEASRCHAAHFLGFARAADSGLQGPDEVDWTEQVELELDNLRAAVAWAVDTDQAEVGLGIIAALMPAFGTRIGAPFGPITERAAAMPGAVDHPLRCVALASAARSAADRGQREQANVLAERALAEATRLPAGERRAWAWCRVASGVSAVMGPWVDRQPLLELADERVAAANELGNPWEQCRALVILAATRAGEPEGRAAGDEAIRLARQIRNPSSVAYALMFAAPTIAPSDPARAAAMLEEAIAVATAANNSFASMQAHQSLGRAQAMRGDPPAAARAYLTAARLARGSGDRSYLWTCVAGVASQLAEVGASERALLLATWAARNAGWLPDWAAMYPIIGPSGALRRAHDSLTASEREQVLHAADAIDDIDALTLAATGVDDLPP